MLTFIRVLVNLFVLFSLAGVAFLSYWITAQKTPSLIEENGCSSTQFSGIDNGDILADMKVKLLLLIIITIYL